MFPMHLVWLACKFVERFISVAYFKHPIILSLSHVSHDDFESRFFLTNAYICYLIMRWCSLSTRHILYANTCEFIPMNEIAKSETLTPPFFALFQSALKIRVVRFYRFNVLTLTFLCTNKKKRKSHERHTNVVG